MFRRRTAAAPGPAESSPSSLSSAREAARDPRLPAADTGPGGKGRPTPKRREAEQLRKQRLRPTVDRREARRRQREQMRKERLRVREAMAQGDERGFPPRDQGPVRAFVRDYVDSRRRLAEFFLPVVLVVLLLSFVRDPRDILLSYALWLASMVVVVVEVVLLTVRLRREVRRRFPGESGGGHGMYAAMRATQLRRMRLPKPRVQPGASL